MNDPDYISGSRYTYFAPHGMKELVFDLGPTKGFASELDTSSTNNCKRTATPLPTPPVHFSQRRQGTGCASEVAGRGRHGLPGRRDGSHLRPSQVSSIPWKRHQQDHTRPDRFIHLGYFTR